MKSNYHRELHHALTTGKMSPEDYTKKMNKFNRESMRKMLRQNMKSLKDKN